MRSLIPATRYTLTIVLFVLMFWAPESALAGPAADGGGFPTPTPTQTPLPTQTPTPTATQQTIILTLEIPTATPTTNSLNPNLPSNIIMEPTPEPIDTGGNPLVSLAYVVLFIFLVVGGWMLFSRRGGNP